MGKIFGISNLPVSSPFPSIESREIIIKRPICYIRGNAQNQDVYIRKNTDRQFWKRALHRLTHK